MIWGKKAIVISYSLDSFNMQAFPDGNYPNNNLPTPETSRGSSHIVSSQESENGIDVSEGSDKVYTIYDESLIPFGPQTRNKTRTNLRDFSALVQTHDAWFSYDGYLRKLGK